jgi:hypothetical protein
LVNSCCDYFFKKFPPAFHQADRPICFQLTIIWFKGVIDCNDCSCFLWVVAGPEALVIDVSEDVRPDSVHPFEGLISHSARPRC